MLGTSAKECSTIAGKFIAELDWAGAVSAKKPLQLAAAIKQWLVAQILAIQVENVEGVKAQRVRKPSDGRPKRLEIRHASLILDDNLAIKNGSTTRKCASLTDNAGIPLGPIEAVAGVSVRLAPFDYQERAVAVMLDLMNPVGALRRLFDR